jgi:hypothetical protein
MIYQRGASVAVIIRHVQTHEQISSSSADMLLEINAKTKCALMLQVMDHTRFKCVYHEIRSVYLARQE